MPLFEGVFMHIPDGFLDLKTALATGVLAAAGLGLALRDARRTLPPRKVPLLGLAAAFVFAAQMLNFPVIGGTSGHLVGAVLAAALLGPAAAVIVLSAVLIVQCFMFADGGVTALGANIFNMGIIGGVVGWVVYAAVARLIQGLYGRVVAAVVASWIGIVLAAIMCAGELAASGRVPWSAAFPAMAGVHMLIGIGEGLITGLVLASIGAARPDLLGLNVRQPRGFDVLVAGAPPSPVPPTPYAETSPEPQAKSLGTVLVFGLLVSLGLALFVAPFACSWPDGLDKAAEVLGFADREVEHRAVPALVPDYKMPFIGSPALATSIAGAAGTLVVFGGALVLARVLVRKTKPAAKNT
jgi:cobalt/nickel transport system permease protein